MDDNNNPNNFGSFDDNNNQDNFGAFNSNNAQDNFGSFDTNNNGIFEPVNNTANPYELFNDNMPYEQNNNIDSNAQYEQPNDLSDNMPYSLDNNFNPTAPYDPNNIQYGQDNSFDNNTQYNQDSSFDNSMQYGQVNNDVNAYQPIDNNTNVQYNQANSYDSNIQYNQPNGFDSNMQYDQSNNFDSNMQYDQTNGFDNNMQYSQDNNFDSNMQYNQGSSYDNNMQYGQVDNVSSYQSFDNNADSNYSSDFAKAWMGKLYDKAHSKKFNWCSAIFGGTYFMYRKMYVSGLLFVILFNLTFLIPSLMFFNGIIDSVGLYIALCIIVPLIFMIIFGFAFYPLYKSFVDNKLKKLKSTITDNSAIVNAASSQGGTSVLGIVIALIVSGIITTVGLGSTIANAVAQLSNKLPDQSQNPDGITNDITEPITDMKSYNFLDEYSIEYDSLSWFFNPIDNTLTKGNYSLIYSGQYLDNIANNFSIDVTNNAGRSSLLNSLVSNLESQAVAINLAVEVGTSTFVANNNSYYAYIDIISDSAISRYYLLLLPEKDILFQFILASNDTSIDYATNLEVINILTSVYAEDSDIPDDEDGNVISNEISNQVSNTIDNSVSNELGTTSNTVSNEVGNNSANNVNDNTIQATNQTVENNQVPLQSILH